MTQALKVHENDLDKFFETMLKDYVDSSSQQLLWNDYLEFKRNYESIMIEDPKEETEARLKTHVERVDEVFKTLKGSMQLQELPVYQELEGEVNSCNVKDKAGVANLVCKLQKIEHHVNYTALKISFYLGFLFKKLKKVYRSVQRLITALHLQVSRQYVQDKISLYELLNQYPRLHACKVSPSYLKTNRRLFIEEAPYRQDREFWLTK